MSSRRKPSKGGSVETNARGGDSIPYTARNFFRAIALYSIGVESPSPCAGWGRQSPAVGKPSCSAGSWIRCNFSCSSTNVL